MHTFPMLLIGIFTSSVVASAPADLSVADEQAGLQPRWHCFTAEDAQDRKQQVEHGMLPRVVFVGESQAISIESRMVHYKTPALSVAVIRRGKLDWSAAWGQLQIDGVVAGCDSLFQAGSLAKPVTLFAALRMQQQGVIDFDADVETYLTSYHLPAARLTPTRSPCATCSHILLGSHPAVTSGMHKANRSPMTRRRCVQRRRAIQK